MTFVCFNLISCFPSTAPASYFWSCISVQDQFPLTLSACAIGQMCPCLTIMPKFISTVKAHCSMKVPQKSTGVAQMKRRGHLCLNSNSTHPTCMILSYIAEQETGNQPEWPNANKLLFPFCRSFFRKRTVCITTWRKMISFLQLANFNSWLFDSFQPCIDIPLKVVIVLVICLFCISGQFHQYCSLHLVPLNMHPVPGYTQMSVKTTASQKYQSYRPYIYIQAAT